MIKKYFVRSEFIKNVFALTSGTVISQAIPIAISPVLSRLYTTEDFGKLALFVSILSAIALLVSARYDIAIVLPKDDKDAVNLLAITFFFTILISLISLIIVLIINLANLFSIDGEYRRMLFFLPPVLFFIGICQSLCNWANRKKNYKSIISYRVSNSMVNGGLNIVLGFFKFSSLGLLFSLFFGNLISMIVLFIQLVKDLYLLRKEISFSKMKAMAIHYIDFPRTNSLQALSDMFQINGTIYFASYFFTSTVVGAFSYTIRVLQVPMNFLGSAMAQVFYQQASEYYNNGKEVKSFVKSTIIKSAVIGFPIMVVILVWGPQLFSFIFGEQWRIAGVYARILAPWIFLDFIRAPISQVPLIIRQQKKMFRISLIGNFILIFSMLYGGIWAKDIMSGFIIFSIFQSLFVISLIIWIYKISGYSINSNK